MKAVSVLFAITLIIFSSCNENQEKQKRKIIKDSKGHIEAELSFNKDSILDGACYYYYKNGKISSIANYKNGKVEGTHISYYENGNIKSVLSLNNNFRNGNCFWFHENKVLKDVSFYLEGKRFGNSFVFNQEGHLTNFTTFDFDSDPQYIVEYDSGGVKIKEEGIILGQAKIGYDKDSIPLNQNISFRISTTVAPHTLNKVEVLNFKDSFFISSEKLKIIGNISSYNCKFNKLGKNKIAFVGKQYDLRGEILRCDTLELNLNVIQF